MLLLQIQIADAYKYLNYWKNQDSTLVFQLKTQSLLRSPITIDRK